MPLLAFLAGWALGFVPFAWWAMHVEPTPMDPDLPAAAWVFALSAGNAAGIGLGGLALLVHTIAKGPPISRRALVVGCLCLLVPVASAALWSRLP